jgi:hypothetical protein
MAASKKQILGYVVLCLVCLVMVLFVTTGIRTLVGGGAREQELKDLLGQAKKEFLAASATFGLLDTTYTSLDVEYDTVFTNADSISANLTEVDAIATGIGEEFTAVTTTFSKIEEAYTGVIQQYNDVCTVAGLAYLRTGSVEHGIPVQILYYPYGGNNNTMTTVHPILHPTSPDIIYTDDNNFVDSTTKGSGGRQQGAVVPVLRALDLDGSLTTRDSGGAQRPKVMTVYACFLDNTYQFVEIKTSLEDRSETFVVDEALYARATREGYQLQAVEIDSFDAESMYAFEASGTGTLRLRKLAYTERAAIENGDGPAYTPATLRDLTKLQGETFDNITPSIDRVRHLNNNKNIAMAEATRARAAIATSQQTRAELSTTHQKLVDQFEAFSVERLVPPRDLLDSYCTVM